MDKNDLKDIVIIAVVAVLIFSFVFWRPLPKTHNIGHIGWTVEEMEVINGY